MNDTERRLKELFRGIAADARRIAESAISAEIGTLIRGGKVLWSALPYPKAGTTNGPSGGHVGGVQPDGVTILLDPVTGIITAGAGIGLPAGVPGDITYVDDTDTWVVRHIGDPTDILYVDPITHKPIWLSLADLGVLLGPIVAPILDLNTIVIGSSTNAKALSLWTGSSNASPPGGPPPWYDPAYVDTVWPHAVLGHINPSFPAPAGTVPLWSSFQPVSHTEICLFRQVVTIPNHLIATASISLRSLGTPILAVYINGTLLGGNTYPDLSNFTASVPVGLVPQGADVVIAWECQNYDGPGDPVADATGQFQLTLTLG